MSDRKEFLTIYGIQALVSISIAVWGFSFLYLFKQGFSFAHIIACYVIVYLVATLCYFLFRSLRTSNSFYCSLFLRALIYIMLVFLLPSNLVYLALFAVVFGVMVFWFWMPWNVKFFSFSNKDNKAFLGSLSVILPPIISAVLPFLTGAIITVHGYDPIFIFVAFSLFIAMFVASKIKKHIVIKLEVKERCEKIKKIAPLFLVEGFWQGVNWIAVPLVTITFITEEIKFGAFFSIIGLAGVFASLITSRISDKMKNRSAFIYPSIILLAVFTLASASAVSFVEWTLLRAITGFFVILASPFMVAIALDFSKDLKSVLVGREFSLNIGRVLGCLVLFGFYIFSKDLLTPIKISSLVILFYLFFLMKEKILEKEKRMGIKEHLGAFIPGIKNTVRIASD